jgi:hypothetical protein
VNTKQILLKVIEPPLSHLLKINLQLLRTCFRDAETARLCSHPRRRPHAAVQLELPYHRPATKKT